MVSMVLHEHRYVMVGGPRMPAQASILHNSWQIGSWYLQAGQVYRWRMVQASTMKWMDLSLNGTGCHWGLYSRDGNFLRSFPRMTDHIVMSAANR